jgi:hypothetical protein
MRTKENEQGGTMMQAPSRRTEVKRGKARASYDPEVVREILGEGLFCHVGVSLGDHPAVIPTAYAVMGDEMVLHGSTANRIYRVLRDGAEACVTVTLLDGLVLARSAFHHSVNYRSVVIYGHPREVTDEAEKHRAFDALIDHIVPGRSKSVRGVNREEFLRTMVLALSLKEASVKIRQGPPVDEEEDYDLEIWAGEIPLRVVASRPVTDPRSQQDEIPDEVDQRVTALSSP